MSEEFNSLCSFFVGDCFDLLSGVKDESIQLCFTSPPYNIGKEYEKRDNLSSYLESQTHIIKEIIRCLKSKGSLCWQVGSYVVDGEIVPLDILFYPIIKNFGMKLRNRIIWKFGHGLHCSKRFSGRYESILWFTKSDDYFFDIDNVRIPSKYPNKKHYKGLNKGKLSCNPKGKNPSDVWDNIKDQWNSLIWDIPNVKSNHPEKTIHPCQFPVEIVERCIMSMTNEGDIVLDPFAGVGSTGVASVKNDRKCILMEKNSEYMRVAKDRVDRCLMGDLPIREFGKPVYSP